MILSLSIFTFWTCPNENRGNYQYDTVLYNFVNLPTMQKRSLYLITGNVHLIRFRPKNLRNSFRFLVTSLTSKTKRSIVHFLWLSTRTSRRSRVNRQRKSNDSLSTSKETRTRRRHFIVLQCLQRIARTIHQMVPFKYRSWRSRQDGWTFPW